MKILDEIRGRLEAATPGPWRWDEEFGAAGDQDLALTNEAGAEIVGAYNDHCCSFRIPPSVADSDAEFIAHAPADVATMLDLVHRATSLIRDLTDSEDCHFDHHGGCQAHGYLSLAPGETCPQYDAKEWAKAMESKA